METARWPTYQHIPDPVKQVVAQFYDLVDSRDSHCSSVELAYTIFAPTGEFLMNKRRLKGPQREHAALPRLAPATPQLTRWGSIVEIVKWRQGWESITYRRHEVFRVYVSDGPGDLMMMGNLTMGLDDSTTAESPFCARCVIDDVESDQPRIQLWQGWLVSLHRCED